MAWDGMTDILQTDGQCGQRTGPALPIPTTTPPTRQPHQGRAPHLTRPRRVPSSALEPPWGALNALCSAELTLEQALLSREGRT